MCMSEVHNQNAMALHSSLYPVLEILKINSPPYPNCEQQQVVMGKEK